MDRMAAPAGHNPSATLLPAASAPIVAMSGGGALDNYSAMDSLIKNVPGVPIVGYRGGGEGETGSKKKSTAAKPTPAAPVTPVATAAPVTAAPAAPVTAAPAAPVTTAAPVTAVNATPAAKTNAPVTSYKDVTFSNRTFRIDEPTDAQKNGTAWTTAESIKKAYPEVTYLGQKEFLDILGCDVLPRPMQYNIVNEFYRGECNIDKSLALKGDCRFSRLIVWSAAMSHLRNTMNKVKTSNAERATVVTSATQTPKQMSNASTATEAISTSTEASTSMETGSTSMEASTNAKNASVAIPEEVEQAAVAALIASLPTDALVLEEKKEQAEARPEAGPEERPEEVEQAAVAALVSTLPKEPDASEANEAARIAAEAAKVAADASMFKALGEPVALPVKVEVTEQTGATTAASTTADVTAEVASVNPNATKQAPVAATDATIQPGIEQDAEAISAEGVPVEAVQSAVEQGVEAAPAVIASSQVEAVQHFNSSSTASAAPLTSQQEADNPGNVPTDAAKLYADRSGFPASNLQYTINKAREKLAEQTKEFSRYEQKLDRILGREEKQDGGSNEPVQNFLTKFSQAMKPELMNPFVWKLRKCNVKSLREELQKAVMTASDSAVASNETYIGPLSSFLYYDAHELNDIDRLPNETLKMTLYKKVFNKEAWKEIIEPYAKNIDNYDTFRAEDEKEENRIILTFSQLMMLVKMLCDKKELKEGTDDLLDYLYPPVIDMIFHAIDAYEKYKDAYTDLQSKPTFIESLDKIYEANNRLQLFVRFRNDDDGDNDCNRRFNVILNNKKPNDFLMQYDDKDESDVKPNSYPYSYAFGRFSHVFLPNEKNNDIATKMQDIVKKLEEGKPVWMMGYGASGAGKTSSLIYLTKTKENGILMHLCNQLTYDTVTVTCVELYQRKELETKKSEPFVFKKNGTEFLLEEEQVHRNHHPWRMDGQGDTKFNQGASLGEVIVHLVDTDRFVRPTTNNPQSSRSHSLVFLEFGGDKKATLIIGDFAGVENAFTCDKPETRRAFLGVKGSSDVPLYSESLENDTIHGGGGGKGPNARRSRKVMGVTVAPPSPAQSTVTRCEKLAQTDYLARTGPLFNFENSDAIPERVKGTSNADLIALRNYINYVADIKATGDIASSCPTYDKIYAWVKCKKNIQTLFDELDTPLNTLNESTKKYKVGTKGSKEEQLEALQKDYAANKMIEVKEALSAFHTTVSGIVDSYHLPYQHIEFISAAFIGTGTSVANKVKEEYKKAIQTQLKPISEAFDSFSERHATIEQGDERFKKLTTSLVDAIQDLEYETRKRESYGEMICTKRRDEGTFINSTMFQLRSLFQELMKRMNQANVDSTPYVMDKCLTEYYADPESIDTMSGGDLTSILMNTIRDQLSFSEEAFNQFIGSLTLSVFCVVNLSKRANNPPPVPYVDINRLKQLLREPVRKEISEELSRIVYDITDKFNDKLNWMTLQQGSRGNSILKDIQSISKKEGNVTPNESTSIRDLVTMIDKNNAATTIGTLEFMDTLSKMYTTSNLCRIPLEPNAPLTQGMIDTYIPGAKPLYPIQAKGGRRRCALTRRRKVHTHHLFTKYRTMKK